MSLKEKLLQKDNSSKCINCKYYERLQVHKNPSYCNATDKIILEQHIDVIRKCDNFELSKE